MPKIALPFAACLLALATIGADAQTLWKWRDATGELHISDTAPPPGTPARNIVSSPAGGMLAPAASPAAAPVPASGASGNDSALDKKKKAADKEKADKAAADKAALDKKNASTRADNCQRATNEAAGLQAGNRIAVSNAQGERSYLDDAARAAEVKRMQDVMAQNCGAAAAAQ